MPSRAFICGCSGVSLTDEERDFFRKTSPWGLILFKRNVQDRDQLKILCAQFREAVGRDDAPILIDQEGGRVQRMTAPHWPLYPSAARVAMTAGMTAGTHEEQARLAFLVARLIAHDLREVGISVNCAPVLDLPAADAHGVIGDRAYGGEVAIVARLARATAEGLLAGAVLPVCKHAPGHGRARADSHLELPIVTTARAELEKTDFLPFRVNADLPAAMTAHVVYSAIDPVHPGTLSPIVVHEIIRGWIGFDGLLMSDDLSMKALSGDFATRTRAMFAAGVDMALHCNGDLTEARAVAEAAPHLSGEPAVRAQRALAAIAGGPEPFDPVDGRAELNSRLAMVA